MPVEPSSEVPDVAAPEIRPKKGRRLVLLVLVSTLIALLQFELGLRLLGERIWRVEFVGHWDWVVYDPFMRWENKRSHEKASFEMNAFGMRSPETTVEKPPGVTRIVSLGDSSTFGFARKGPDEPMVANYPAELSELMSRSGRTDVEVLNAGVIGYSSGHGLRQLVHRVVEFDPDVVTVRFGFNGHSPAWDPSLRAIEPPSRIGRSLLYAAADTGIGRFLMYATRRMGKGGVKPNTVLFSGEEQFEHDVRRFAEVAEQEGFALIVLDYPLRELERGFSKDAPEFELKLLGVESLDELHALHERWQARQHSAVEELGLLYLDTKQACAIEKGRCFNDYDMVHPSEYGQRLTASLLLQTLVSEKLIPAPASVRP